MTGNECYLCGNSNQATIYSINSCKVVQCDKCSLMSTVLLADRSVQSCNENYYDCEKWGHSYFAIQEKLKVRYTNVLSDIKKYKQTGSLLDVGCSLGFFLDTAREQGFTTYGVEPVDSAAAFAQKQLNLNVSNTTLEQAKFSDGFFDVICLFDVLEHIPAPLEILDEVKRILKDDGLLVIQCPNINSNMAKLTKQYWRWLLVPQHLFHFSRETLTALFKKAGIHILKWNTFDDEHEFVDNVAEASIRLSIKPKILQKILLKFRIILLPTINLLFKFRYSKKQSTEGGVIIFFTSKDGLKLP